MSDQAGTFELTSFPPYVPPHNNASESTALVAPLPKVSINQGDRVKLWEKAWEQVKKTHPDRAALYTNEMNVVIYGGPLPLSEGARLSGKPRRWRQFFLIDRFWREAFPPSEPVEEGSLRSTLMARLASDEESMLLDGETVLSTLPGNQGGCDSMFISNDWLTTVLERTAKEISAMSAKEASSIRDGAQSVRRVLFREALHPKKD